jgi:hypothetical protein
MSYPAVPPVLRRIEAIGGAIFTSGAYNLNLFGIRTSSRDAGSFDDLIGCAYRETDGGAWRVEYWPATTDPGVYYLENPMRVEGCAALVADRQYRGAWQVGKHRGAYRALVQRSPVAIHRDNNLDRVLDYSEDTITEGVFGINIHKAGSNSTIVGRWSAGCQVHATEAGFSHMMELVDRQFDVHPTWSKVSYTLLSQWW